MYIREVQSNGEFLASQQLSTTGSKGAILWMLNYHLQRLPVLTIDYLIIAFGLRHALAAVSGVDAD